MSITMLRAAAQRMEAPKYNPTPASRIGFRPHMSESFTHTGEAAVLAMTYAPPIQE
jgi:hypothetical protein